MNTVRKNAFTIIELLTVVAVIAILSSILIPAAGGVIKQSRIAASKAQLLQYVNAIENFKAEYNYYPTFFKSENKITIQQQFRSRRFIEGLSGRSPFNGAPVKLWGNFRSIQFHSFPASECYVEDDGSINRVRLADRFNNVLIKFKVDFNGDGLLRPDPVSGRDPERPPGNVLRTNVTAWVLESADGSLPGYSLWD